MVGAMLGAQVGYDELPEGAVALITSVNDLDLDPLVDGLLRLRGDGE